MTLNIERIAPWALEMDVHGKLDKDDYRMFVPLFEQLIERYGQIALLIHVADFGGWTAGALWQDIKFDIKHYRHVSRLALVGQNGNQRWMAKVSEPFTGAEVRYFAEAELASARRWVERDRESYSHAEHSAPM